MKTLNVIEEAIRLCENQNRKPILILMNSDIQKLIIDEVKWIDDFDTKIDVPSLFGLPIISCNVRDFLIIDDRCWYEQKF